jgi:hypothetical protein
MQKILRKEQIEEFHHDEFVEDQVRHFSTMVKPDLRMVIVDVGGGMGAFAHRLQEVAGHEVRVLDLDAASIELCARRGVTCAVGDALNPDFRGDEQMATFNMILHHLVSSSERDTRRMQSRAIQAWRQRGLRVFVNEYIYESFAGNFSGWMIYQVTKSRVLSWIGRMVSKVMPSLRANTFGVGVRFRALGEWHRLFEAAGYKVVAYQPGVEEPVTLPMRLLLIKSRRRDSFLLEPRPG